MTANPPDPRLAIAVPPAAPDAVLTAREWLVCNGLGGYAAGTIGGLPTRRYHGFLIAALPNPAGRVMMLSSLAEQIRWADGSRADIGWIAPPCTSGRALPLVDFHLELGLPVWTFSGSGITIERRIVVAYGHNTTTIVYRLVAGDGPVRIEVRPSLQFRGHDEPVSTAVPEAYSLQAFGARVEMNAPANLPNLRFRFVSPRTSFVIDPMSIPDVGYVIEESRGYASRGNLYSPGRFRADLPAGESIALIASTESWDTVMAIGPQEAVAAEIERRHRLIAAAPEPLRAGAAAELVLAADQFVIRPAGRHEDHVRARIEGGEAWTVIAGYHWFTDWGRDTMISLEGLALCTGRLVEAQSILRMFAHHVKNGLVPNMFPEGANEGLYHTADATLWFFHAIDRYVQVSNDQRLLAQMLPILRDIIEQHIRGTLFNIHVDPNDGLLVQGQEGYQLTWMDAKAGNWVVTPRRGKAVEINALWYNALCLVERWSAAAGDAAGATRMRAVAEQAHTSFQRRFWNPATGCLFDIVDAEGGGDDPAIRPNQLFAISLPNAVLDRTRWASVVAVVERDLLTPVGLRSLAPQDPQYKPTYRGDLLARDGAYHQGTVWSWLIGPYVDARLRLHPDDVAGTRARLEGLIAHLGENCIGYVGEVFDAEAPFAPGGCVAQAWGVAELLRCLHKTGS